MFNTRDTNKWCKVSITTPMLIQTIKDSTLQGPTHSISHLLHSTSTKMQHQLNIIRHSTHRHLSSNQWVAKEQAGSQTITRISSSLRHSKFIINLIRMPYPCINSQTWTLIEWTTQQSAQWYTGISSCIVELTRQLSRALEALWIRSSPCKRHSSSMSWGLTTSRGTTNRTTLMYREAKTPRDLLIRASQKAWS
jgi:hypothetical protein